VRRCKVTVTFKVTVTSHKRAAVQVTVTSLGDRHLVRLAGAQKAPNPAPFTEL